MNFAAAMDRFSLISDKISDIVWGLPTVALILFAGIFYTFSLGVPQITALRQMKSVLRKNLFSGGKPLRVISTALAATVGTGSIAGVATALTLGGAGAVFWLWVSAFFGMAVAFSEGGLSIKYRNGKKGGIMYAIEQGMKENFLAKLYALFTVFASFGMGGMVQSNSAAKALSPQSEAGIIAVGIVFAAVTAACLFSKRDFTGKLSALLIPILSAVYIFAMAAVIAVNIEKLPQVMSMIIRSAFGIKPLAGSAAGISVKQAISVGFKRGIFSNEAGLGTTAAIHADGNITDPCEQGLMNMFEVIVDTFVICTLTAFAILLSGVTETGLDGAELVAKSCETAIGGASGLFVSICTAGFAIATTVGWSKIGLSAAEYLGNGRHLALYKLALTAAVFIGAVISLSAAWKLSDIFNGLMIYPCTAALFALRREIISEKPRRNKGNN